MIKSAMFVLSAALLTCVVAFGLQQGSMQKAMAQKPERVADRVEQAFKAREPGWKLSRKIKGQTQDIHEWKFRGETVTFSISELASPQDAAQRLQQSTALIATGDVKRLPNLGDEAYYRAGDSRSTSTIHFRKGNVFIIVNAPSMSLARRFAKDIEKEIDGN